MTDPTFTHQVAMRLHEDRLEEAMRRAANQPATRTGLLESVRARYSQLRQQRLQTTTRVECCSRTLCQAE